MFIGHIDQALSRKLNCKYKRKLVNASWLEKYKKYDENSCFNKSADKETADESDDDIPLAQLQRNMRENQTKETGNESDGNILSG